MGLFASKLLEYKDRNDPSRMEIDTFDRNDFGVTVEEVLAIAYARLYTLNQKLPCRENSLALTKIEEAGMWLDQRTEDRRYRGVEGTKEK